MNKQELIEKITQKKEFSELPRKDVEFVLKKFNKKNYLDEEKIKLTRDLLRKIFSAFTSQKLLSQKDKPPLWILNKHLSTRERFPYYKNIYKRILKGLGKEISIIDLGAGVNGFSYTYFEKTNFKVSYLAIEAIGQLVRLMNNYFKKNKINGNAVHFSLLELGKIRREIQKTKEPRVIFLFKAIDSLELLERNYSKELISEISDLAERIVVSFPIESMIKRKKFKVKRVWILNFIKSNFKLLDDFQLGAERYLVFSRK